MYRGQGRGGTAAEVVALFLGNGCFLFSVSFGPARSLALRFTHSSALRLFRAVACSSLLRIQTCNRAAAFVAISAATLQHRGPNTSFPSFNNSYQRWCPTPSALDSFPGKQQAASVQATTQPEWAGQAFQPEPQPVPVPVPEPVAVPVRLRAAPPCAALCRATPKLHARNANA